MMDKITCSFLEEFVTSYGFEKLSESTQFEHFCNYCTLSAETGVVGIDIQDMYTGESAQGIDGLAIDVNGSIVSCIDDIELLIKQNKRLDVRFIFVQAKTEEKFDNKEIGNFLSFVNSFFSQNATAVFCTPEMQNFIEMKEYIYNNSKYMKSSNPSVVMYYISLGKWNEKDTSLNAVIDVQKNSLEQTNLFSNISFIPCDAQKLQSMYRKSSQQLSAKFVFTRQVMMFSDENGDCGYSGILPFKEFKKIICEDNGAIKKVFEDNIRDYLGEKNYVNSAIEETVYQGKRSSFCMLNNGITIVARSAISVGDTMTIDDYQIVNGCQTSHVLYSNRDNDKINDLLIPVKIIVTEDEDLKNKITKATNNQTSITKEQLEALSSYQKTLEEYYKTFSSEEDRLYYERRAGQYRSETIPKNRIVSIRSQIKNASSMFNDKPHDAAGHYSALLKDVGTKLFKKDDRPSMYYTSSLALFRLSTLIKTKVIDNKYGRAKYHMIMLFKYMMKSTIPKYSNAKRMDALCEEMQRILNDPVKCAEYFTEIANYISNQECIDVNDRKVFERKETTDVLLANVHKLKQ